MDEFVVGRKAIIEYLRAALDLSPDPRVAWNKIMRRRKDQGMNNLFHRDIAGRPYILKTEVKEWIMKTDGKAQRVQRGFELKSSKEMLPGNTEDCQ